MILFPLVLIGVLLCLYIYVVIKTKPSIFDFENVPFSKYTLVLGAGLEKNGLPTDILSDRVETAIELLNLNKTDFLIFSGSVNPQDFSEPESMLNLACSFNVNKTKLYLDNQGKTTFDSLINTLKVFGNGRITIITQRFHLPRALWLAESLKINAQGLPANIYYFSVFKTVYWYLREVFALPKNIMKLIFYHSKNNC